MGAIVGVHGIGKYRYYREAGNSVAGAQAAMRAKWDRYLHHGLSGGAPHTGQRYITEIAYYAHLLGETKDDGGDGGGARAVERMDAGTQRVLVDWTTQLDAVGEGLTGALHWLAGRLLERLPEQTARFAALFAPEVAAYLAAGGEARAGAREAVAEVIRRHRPRVVIAHSLGSVVAYETLWACPELEVELLVTLGSPLGMRNVVFDHLLPAPVNGRGARPPQVRRWVNIADRHDIAAIPPGLASCFTGVDHERLVDLDRLDFHTVEKYLGCGALGEQLRPYLT
ncbi:hypothetical protein ACFOWE_17690 [Planomonospora corallina]|uniref:Serine peptidase n=1 Tax=Planomonospora corallina TaxID=1806052 RepID=A0ABV8I8D0_9ACTN